MAKSMSLENLHIKLIGTGINKYPAKQHTQNVVRHMEVSDGLIYVPGQHELSVEDSDFNYPFRQRRAFCYMSGVNEPDCHLTYDIRKDESVLYIPHISAKQAVWFGRGSTLDDARKRYDVDKVRWSSNLFNDLQQWIDDHNEKYPIYLLNPSLRPQGLSSPVRYNTTLLPPAVASSRTIKTPHEINLIRHAISISSHAHTTILHHLASLPPNEAAIHGLFLNICTTNHAPLQAYAPIVASGPNASILHYTANNRTYSPPTDLLTLDAGAEYACYASDITRTFPLHPSGHWPSPEATALYALVSLMQTSCLRQLKPGVHFSALFRLAQRIAVRGLIQLGLLKLSDTADQIDGFIDMGGIYAFFPHGLGHHLGLDVHDVGPIDSQPTVTSSEEKEDPSSAAVLFPPPPSLFAEPSTPLAAGMVLTVEPGLYFNAYTLEKLYLRHAAFAAVIDFEVLEKYIKVGGVRIEDDVLITRDGYEVLSEGAVKGEEMLRVIREGGRCGHGEGCEFKVGRVGM